MMRAWVVVIGALASGCAVDMGLRGGGVVGLAAADDDTSGGAWGAHVAARVAPRDEIMPLVGVELSGLYTQSGARGAIGFDFGIGRRPTQRFLALGWALMLEGGAPIRRAVLAPEGAFYGGARFDLAISLEGRDERGINDDPSWVRNWDQLVLFVDFRVHRDGEAESWRGHEWSMVPTVGVTYRWVTLSDVLGM